MSRIVIVHGINTHGGGIDRMGGRLESLGYEVVYFEYERRHFYSYWNKKTMIRDGRLLANFMRDGDHAICHSNGAIVWQQSINAGAKWGKCFLFGAACTSDEFNYPDGCIQSAQVMYNPADTALLLGSFLPWHPFGRMGRRGFAWNPPKGIDRRFSNVPVLETNTFSTRHSHYFKPAFSGKMDKIVTDDLGDPKAIK